MKLSDLRGWVRNPRVPKWKKALGVFAVLYVVMPFDFIPDAIPVLGWLDDLGVLGFFVTTLLRDLNRTPADEVIDAR